MVFQKGHIPIHKGVHITLNTGKTHFKKGFTPWNKGKKMSLEHRKKLSESHKGFIMPQSQKSKISDSLKGNPSLGWSRGTKLSADHIKKLMGRTPWNKGKKMIEQSGTNHHNWKGGRSILKSGYILIQSKDHPRATKDHPYIYEHVLVMENHIGRLLKPHEVVHHINMDRSDNGIKNLMLMTDSEHMKHHMHIKSLLKKPTSQM